MQQLIIDVLLLVLPPLITKSVGYIFRRFGGRR